MSGPRFFAPTEVQYVQMYHVRTDCASCEATGRVLDERMQVTVTCGRCRGAGWGYTLTRAARQARDKRITENLRRFRGGDAN